MAQGCGIQCSASERGMFQSGVIFSCFIQQQPNWKSNDNAPTVSPYCQIIAGQNNPKIGQGICFTFSLKPSAPCG